MAYSSRRPPSPSTADNRPTLAQQCLSVCLTLCLFGWASKDSNTTQRSDFLYRGWESNHNGRDESNTLAHPTVKLSWLGWKYQQRNYSVHYYYYYDPSFYLASLLCTQSHICLFTFQQTYICTQCHITPQSVLEWRNYKHPYRRICLPLIGTRFCILPYTALTRES